MKYFRNTNTKEIHLVSEEGRTLEICNIDDARDHDHIDEISEDEALEDLRKSPEHSCGHCFEKKEIDGR